MAEYKYQGSMNEIMSRIDSIKTNPALIQRSIIDYLSEITSGEIDIVDATNPFVLLLETSAANTAIAINHSDLNLRRQYPALAITDEDIYRHMSDKEIMHRYSSPSSAEFLFMIPYDEFIKNAQPHPEDNYIKLTIPKDSYIKVDDVEYSFSYPVDIKMYSTGGVSVSYDTSEVSPIEDITTNNIMPQLKRMPDGTRILYFSLKLKQLRVVSNLFTVEQKSIFRKTVAFKDKFFFARAYHKGAITDNKWVELNTTHTDQVYNLNVPTMCFKVLSNELQVYIPHVYIINELIGSNIRVEIYSTKGKLTVDYRDYASSSFEATFRNIDETKDTVYSNALNNVSVRVISTDVSSGGSDGVTFSELRARTINHANGDINLPITNVQNTAKMNNNGFNIVTNIDVLTNRVMLATRRLPTPDNKRLLSPVNTAIITTLLDSNNFIGNPNIVINTDKTTLLPSNLYINDNGVVSILKESDINALKMLTPNELAQRVNSVSYLYTPFYYVLDYSGEEFDVRVYDLDSPTKKELNFIYQNDSMQMPVNSDTVILNKVKNGYELYIKTKSGNFYKQAADSDVGLQIGFVPYGETAMAYINAQLYGVDQDTGERVWKVTLDTNYDIDNRHCLSILNAKQYVDAPLITKLVLDTDIHIFHYTSSVTSLFKATEHDMLLGKFILTQDDYLITHESINIHFGDALDNLWRRSRNIPVGQEYLKHEIDVPLTYDRDIYETNSDGIVMNVVNGKIEYSILHHKGDPVIIDGEQVYKHRKGDVYLDENNNPIVANGVRQIQELDILFIDGSMYFVTDNAMLNYRSQVTEIIKNWVIDDIAGIEDNLLDKTNIYFYPETTLGKVDVYLNDNSEAIIDAPQSFTVTIYVNPAAYENDTVREVIRQATISTIDAHLGGVEVNMGAITADLRKAYDTNVVTFTITGLGGEANYPIVRIKDREKRLCINKRAVAQPDNSIIIEDDVTIIFISYQS